MLVKLCFLLCLFGASFSDLKHRKIPNLFPILIALLALQNFHFWGALLALPFLITAMVDPEKVGGGDIKLTAGIGVFLGWNQGLMALISALFVVILCFFTSSLWKKEERFSEMSAPLAPFLCFGVVFSYLFEFKELIV